MFDFMIKYIERKKSTSSTEEWERCTFLKQATAKTNPNKVAWSEYEHLSEVRTATPME
jgi:hypothetical protein